MKGCEIVPVTADGLARATARYVFKKRGDHSEAHLNEVELAAIIEAAIELFAMKRGIPK